MPELQEMWQSADWKKEKHVPVIDCPDEVTAGEVFQVKAQIGAEVDHPNTTEHHIRWIALYFLADGAKLPVEVGKFDFSAHGESAQGPNEGPVYTHHGVVAMMKTAKSGMLMAGSYCNIHGLWQNSKQIKVK
jgi:superoxide reductase